MANPNASAPASTSKAASTSTIGSTLFSGNWKFVVFGALVIVAAGSPTWRPAVLLLLVALITAQLVLPKPA